jgi:uncharacterized coiled-coil protein SlyX
MMKLSEIAENIKRMGLKATALYEKDKALVTYCRPEKTNLDEILEMLPILPPGMYQIRARKANRAEPIIYEVDTRDQRIFENEEKTKDHSTIGKKNLSDDKITRLGQLEARCEYLEEMIADRDATIASLNSTIDQLEAELELYENAEPETPQLEDQQPKTMQAVLLESLAPVIPSLADKALSWLDKQMSSPAAASPAQAAQPAAQAQPAPPQPLQIDYDLLARKILEHGNPEFESTAAGM